MLRPGEVQAARPCAYINLFVSVDVNRNRTGLSVFDQKRTRVGDLTAILCVSAGVKPVRWPVLSLGGHNNEAAHVHHTRRWYNGDMAAGHACAATAGQAPTYRLPGSECFRVCSMGSCLGSAPARTWVGRRPHSHN